MLGGKVLTVSTVCAARGLEGASSLIEHRGLPEMSTPLVVQCMMLYCHCDRSPSTTIVNILHEQSWTEAVLSGFIHVAVIRVMPKK